MYHHVLKANPWGINQYTKGKGKAKGESRQDKKAARKILSTEDRKAISSGLGEAFSTMAGNAKVKDNEDGTFTVTALEYTSSGGNKKNSAQQVLNEQQAEHAEPPEKGAWDDTESNRNLHAMHSKYTLKVKDYKEKPDPDHEDSSIVTYTVEALQKKAKKEDTDTPSIAGLSRQESAKNLLMRL